MTALGTLLGRRNPLRRRRRASGGVKAVQTFPASPLGIRVALALGADPAADPTTDFAWTDITAYAMLTDGGITIHRGGHSDTNPTNRVTQPVPGLTWTRSGVFFFSCP